ncbi:MAG: PorV/PorQ family protein [Elusimicrobia bacterium]|nr:PorV/PorQ family protein [Candidatus Liberimonas magnetica]
MFKKLCLSIMVLSISAVFSFSASKGTSGAQFLKIVTAPRPAALGGTFAGFSGDVNCMAVNPAGLSTLDMKEASLNQNNWMEGISNQYIAFGMPVNNDSALGVNVTMLSVKDITRTDTSGNTNGTYDASDLAVGIAYARKVAESLSLGLNAKMINSKIENENASAYGVDIGGLYKANEKVDIGLCVQNLGTKMKFIDEADSLPMIVKAGGAYKMNSELTLGADINYPNDSDIYLSAGAEYYIKSGDKLEFPIRAGYRTGMQTGGLSGLGTGLGVLYNKTLGINLAWTPEGDLGDSVKFGLDIKF